VVPSKYEALSSNPSTEEKKYIYIYSEHTGKNIYREREFSENVLFYMGDKVPIR
jgi:hypothetical protein